MRILVWLLLSWFLLEEDGKQKYAHPSTLVLTILIFPRGSADSEIHTEVFSINKALLEVARCFFYFNLISVIQIIFSVSV